MERRRVRESNCSSGKPNVCLPLTLTGCLCSCLSYFPSTYSLLCGSRPVKEHLTTGPDVRQNVRTCADVRAQLAPRKKGEVRCGEISRHRPGYNRAASSWICIMEECHSACEACASVCVCVDVFKCLHVSSQ